MNSRFLISIGKTALKSLLEELTKTQSVTKKGKRRGFSDPVKLAVLLIQDFRCKRCKNILKVVDFHHKDGKRSNNCINNCQALCPNCHAEITRRNNVSLRRIC